MAFWTAWVMMQPTVKEDKKMMVRRMIEKARLRMNAASYHFRMQDHLERICYMTDPELGTKMRQFTIKEMEEDYNRRLANTPPKAKHPDGALCKGLTEELQLDEIPAEAENQIDSMMNYENEDKWENILMDTIHQPLENDGEPPTLWRGSRGSLTSRGSR